MERKDIEAQLITLISTKLDIPANEISPKSFFASDLRVSSYKALELICDIEEAFNCEIPDKDVKKMQKVEDLIDFICKT